MLILKKLEPSKYRPIPLKIATKEFVALWKACSVDPTEENYSAFLKALYPYVNYWNSQLLHCSEKHIGYVSLLQLLASSKSKLTPKQQIVNWIRHVQTHSSVKEELLQILYEQVITFKFVSISYSNEIVLEWTWAEAFKRRLKDRIKNRSFTKIPYFEYNPDWDSFLIENVNMPDIFLINNLKKNPIYNQVIESVLDQDNKIVLKKYTKEYRKLCQLIKTKQ